MEDFLWRALETLLPVLALALTALAGFGIRWLSAHVQSTRVQTLLAWIGESIESSVREIEQTMVEKLKAAAADGKLTEAEKADVLAATIATAKRALGEKGLALLEKAAGVGQAELDDWLKTRIEASVQKMRER